MNLAVNPIASDMLKMTLLLQTLDSGKIIASVLEIPDCQAEAATREEAIAAIDTDLQQRFRNLEVLPIEISIESHETTSNVVNPSNQPWMDFAGIFKDDPYFEKVMQTIQAERDADGDEEIDVEEYCIDQKVAS
jgi:predicted RNase H-like HicB family nuclease